MLGKWGSIGAAWVISDVFTLLQLGWVKVHLPEMYAFTIGVASQAANAIHVVCVEGWTVVREVTVAVASNTS